MSKAEWWLSLVGRYGGSQHLADKERAGSACITSFINLIWAAAIGSKVQGVSSISRKATRWSCQPNVLRNLLYRNILLAVGGQWLVIFFSPSNVSLGHISDLLPADFLPPWLTSSLQASVGAIQCNNMKFELQSIVAIPHGTKLNSQVRKHTNSFYWVCCGYRLLFTYRYKKSIFMFKART